jgi:plasmid replication initiation protein
MDASSDYEVTKVNLSDFKKIYLSDIFAQARDDDVWHTNEKKLALLIFSKISDFRIYHKDITDVKTLADPKIKTLLSKVDRKYEVTKKEFQLATNTNYSNLAREIRKSSKTLVKRSCNLPHPLNPECEDSFDIIQLFSSIKYNHKQGIININFNDEALPYLLYLNKYTILIMSNFFGIKNKYALHMYMYCKILQNKYTKKGIIDSTIDNFKSDLKIEKKYRSFTTFKTYVLDVITDEINSLTDLKFSYELIKSGRSYTDVIFTFSQKNEVSSDDPCIKDNNKQIAAQIETVSNDEILSEPENRKLIFQLKIYGISENKSNQLIDNYGVDIILTCMDSLLEEISNGKKIDNPAGYLISSIKNNSLVVSTQSITDFHKVATNKTKEDNIEREQIWNKIEQYCESIHDGIQSLYSLYMSNSLIYKQSDLEIQNEIRMFLEVNPELAESSRPIEGVYLDDSGIGITMRKLKQLVNGVRVADPIDRLPYLKKAIQQKSQLLNDMSDSLEKSCLENEVNELKDLIVSLI